MQAAHDWQAKQAAIRFAADQLIAAHPHLVAVSDKVDSLIAAAKNIRIELGRAFPRIKFRVTTSRFSGGDSIRVSWTDGPMREQVEKIVNRYEAGSFDGMTDSYNYRSDKAWTTAFGDAKYVQTERHYSDQTLQRVIDRLSREWGLETPLTVADYHNGRIWAARAKGCTDFGTVFNRALSRHTFCA